MTVDVLTMVQKAVMEFSQAMTLARWDGRDVPDKMLSQVITAANRAVDGTATVTDAKVILWLARQLRHDAVRRLYMAGDPDPMVLQEIVIDTSEFGFPLPEWVHDELAAAFRRYKQSGAKLDLNKLVGARREERRPPRIKAGMSDIELADLIGDRLAQNQTLPQRRRRKIGAIWDDISRETGIAESTIRSKWSASLKKIYIVRDGLYLRQKQLLELLKLPPLPLSDGKD